MTAMLLSKEVKARGHEVRGPFRDPVKACDAIREHEPDAALLDVSLENGANSETVARLLNDSGIPFAFVTGYGPETAGIVRCYPDSLVIPKPVSEETLAMILHELLPPKAAAIGC